MKVPIEIAFQGMESSDAVAAEVRRRAEKLERYFNKITSCRVVLESAHKSQYKTNHYEVRVDVSVPGEELVASSDPRPDENDHSDIYIAIRDAFNAVERQVKDYADKLREDRRIEGRVTPPNGVIAKIFEGEGYGFLEVPDGREIYFHQNSVLNGDFDALEVGMEVEFAEEMGNKGPQASTVKIRG